MATRTTQEPDRKAGGGITPTSLFLVLLLFWIVTQVQLVLVLGLLALLFGTILEGPVRFFQKRRFPRPAAILVVYIIIIGSLALLVFSIAPGIADQASEFSEKVPAQLRELRNDWRASDNGLLSGLGVDVLNRAIDTVEGDSDVNVSQDAVARAIPVVTSITGVIVSTVTLLVITFYYLLEKRLLRGLILDTLTPRFRARVDHLWTEVENKVGGWLRGQLLLCLIIGVIATVAYGIIGLDFWPLLGLWAGLTEIIPIIGPWIGGIPAVLIALTISWETTLITIAVIVGMQSLENWVLVPRVMRGAVGLTPLTVFVAILAGTQFMGVVGAVLAIPIAATIQVILTDFLERRADRDERNTARSGWRWMLSRTGLRDVDGDGVPDGDGSDAVNHRDDEAYADSWEGETISWQPPGGDEEPAAPEDAAEAAPEPRSDAEREPNVEAPPTDGAPEPEPTGPEPAPQPAAPAPPEPQSEPESEPDDDESPAFAAWPRPADKTRKRPASSTWPPLEEGRPERLRRPRRDRE